MTASRTDPGATGSETIAGMMGLGRRGLRVAVGGVMAAYVAVGLMLPSLELSPARWVAAVLGSVGLAVSLWLAARGEEDPLGRSATIAVAVIGAVAGAAVWWSIPVGPTNWVRPGAPMVVYAIAMCLLIVRGRVRWAWLGFLAVVGVAAVAAAVWGWRPGTVVPVVLRMLASMVPVTLMMAFVRPLLAFSRVLDRREVAAVEAEAALAATVAQRARTLAELDHEVRPFLEHAARGGHFSADDAVRARLLEAALRDEVRGRGWMSPEVRAEVSAARERGVAVRLFDDRSGDAGAVRDRDRIHAELIDVLSGADRGSVTARLVPAARAMVAVIAESDGASVRRRVCAVDESGEPAWTRDTGGTLSM
ncbi:hypothetical protein [Gordonia neofelifaecis]|uniref:Uncharacterized protein n=1 Tax=Gordonia neofelifaecis NRRL B-59395 TaxID=644548 RepID=F1YJ81_9ACTN|nr:hypothetical protein [Gordonia neofelifaecis]EGD55114.1 hypothetical protein SCNU_09589 [Gordonia neofelifaecis NRRL B-59395]